MQTRASTVAGEITQADEAYAREQAVSWLVLGPMLAVALLGAAVLRLLAAILRSPAPGGLDRGVKELRRGPSTSVKQIWVRDVYGSVIELEVHGFLHPKALLPRDQIIASVRPQRRKDLPPLAYRIENLTTGRMLRPHPPTLWTHLGPPIILQAALGCLVAILVVLALVT